MPFEMVALSSPACGLFAKPMSSASAPRIAAQLLVATTAAPVGSRTTSSTPGIARAARSSIRSGAPPVTGPSFAQAWTSPGTDRSEQKTGSPLTFAGMSRRGTALPASGWSGLRTGSAGTGRVAAPAA